VACTAVAGSSIVAGSGIASPKGSAAVCGTSHDSSPRRHALDRSHCGFAVLKRSSHAVVPWLRLRPRSAWSSIGPRMKFGCGTHTARVPRGSDIARPAARAFEHRSQAAPPRGRGVGRHSAPAGRDAGLGRLFAVAVSLAVRARVRRGRPPAADDVRHDRPGFDMRRDIPAPCGAP
jgi:hypothetical protein